MNVSRSQCNRKNVEKKLSSAAQARPRVAPHIAVLPKSGIRDFFDLVNTMEGVISLGIGEPDFVAPWKIREATIYSLQRGYTHYTSNLGDLKLRQAICKYFQKRFGGKYNPNTECIVTVGVSEGLDIAARAVLSPGDEVLYHEPCYVSYAPTVSMAHGVPVPVLTSAKHDFVVQVKDLEKAVTPKTKVLMLNYPNNPTGAGMTWEDKKKVAEFAIKHDLLVFSDEIYDELAYAERSPSIATLPGMHDRTIVFNGFSKAFAMTGFRIAYAVGPHDLIDAMMKIHQYSMLCAPGLSQYAATEALNNCDEEREAMREEYEQRRNVIVKGFNDMGLKCFMPRGAFYVFPCIQSTGMTSMEFATKLLEEEHVALIPGSAFGTSGEGFVRCSYATAMDEIQEALVHIRAFLKRHKCI
ncbi:MAG: aminotransferase class I/II-fold pyridoxal phosphate-dependent enzyme [Lentisphaeria bacterium]|nr:aminotransferase class I/II-fold pyridoxal phosphate-dependent enzyme [Lentisphaeria bacterium]